MSIILVITDEPATAAAIDQPAQGLGVVDAGHPAAEVVEDRAPGVGGRGTDRLAGAGSTGAGRGEELDTGMVIR